MSKILRLECINDNMGLSPEMLFYFKILNHGKGPPNRYWVAEITGLSEKYKYKRRFLEYKKDYTDSNSIGTRGVYAYYILDNDRIYDVSEPISWGKTDRYFCTVRDDEIIRLQESEVEELLWLSDHLT